MSNPPPPAPAPSILRVRVFVDFWNFTLSTQRHTAGFRIDWNKLGQLIAAEAVKMVAPGATLKYEGMNVYASYDAAKPSDNKLKGWLTNTLDRMPGVSVIAVERHKKRSGPTCPQANCHAVVANCPTCGGDMRGTEEKGVDTRMATDMISLAWIDNYDVAVLVSSDRDFVPVAAFLHTKGVKVVHGAFPPVGSQLSQECWANINLVGMMPTYQRA